MILLKSSIATTTRKISKALKFPSDQTLINLQLFLLGARLSKYLVLNIELILMKFFEFEAANLLTRCI